MSRAFFFFAFFFACSAFSSPLIVLKVDGEHAKIKNGVSSTHWNLREISGLTVREFNSQRELLSIGDHAYQIYKTPLPLNIKKAPEVVDLKWMLKGRNLPGDLPGDLPVALHSQWEAITSDSQGHVYLLQETPGAIFVLNPELTQVLMYYKLIVDSRHTDYQMWRHDGSSRGEGLILLDNGHFLIAQEKHPAMLIEFGPEGDTAQGVPSGFGKIEGSAQDASSKKTFERHLVPLHFWKPSDNHLRDFSELAIYNNQLYVLSDKSARVGRVKLAGLTTKSNTFQWDQLFDLPETLLHPEGLAFLDESRAVIGCDLRGTTDNIYIIPNFLKTPKAPVY